MEPVAKALWRIETRLNDEINLDDLARFSGASRFYLARAFTAIVGLPPIAYARARRLSEAAKALSNGAPDILSVALDWNYGSHEAFTRAFREHFGLTPDEARTRELASLSITEPFTMSDVKTGPIEATRTQQSDAILLAGFSVHFDCSGPNPIPGLWTKFGPHIGRVPFQKDHVAYGVNYNFDDNVMDHLVGVEVSSFEGVPDEYARLRIAPATYAVFTHKGPVMRIRETWAAIWEWLPNSGREAADAPSFERYDERFNPQTGDGEVEIWIPLKA
jgi:AraC family transcriptional regulator